jgi:dienelactone hydrolase
MKDPIATLVNWYGSHPPLLGFHGGTRVDFDQWHLQLREKLCELSGLRRMARWHDAFAVKEEAPVDVGGCTRQRVVIRTAPDYEMPVVVLKPKSAGPFAPVVALHGHGGGVCDVLGEAGTPKDRDRIRAHNYDYAAQTVRRGFIVFAPDKRGFGERGGPGNGCLDLATSAILMGMSVVGLHTWDNQRMLDYIQARDDVRPGGIGCIGLSGGGGGTMWLAAVDDRITCAVVSGHAAVYENGLFGCICNVVPSLLEWADRGEVVGLTAPRPLLIESASEDECYSRYRTLKAYEAVRRIYAAAGAAERLDIDCFEGRHEWSGRKAWPWLEQWLNQPGIDQR